MKSIYLKVAIDLPDSLISSEVSDDCVSYES